MLHFREQFSFPMFWSRELYLYQPVSKVCVCETHLKDSVTPSVIVLLFREQFMLIGNVLSFPENSSYSQCLVKE